VAGGWSEQGVSFVEVSLGDNGRWDTHSSNFETVRELSGELDAGWSALHDDLEARGLLETTTIVWMGEFGRTPQINGSAGRDHFPPHGRQCWRGRHPRRPGVWPHQRRRHDR